MDKWFFENEKDSLKREVIFHSVTIFVAGMIFSAGFVWFGVSIMLSKFFDAFLALLLMAMWIFSFCNDIKFLKKMIDLKINFLNDLHQIKVKAEIDEIKILRTYIKELENKNSSEEQENGDTKEVKCELEQGSEMS